MAAPGRQFTVELDFELPDTTFQVEFVVLAFAGMRLRAMKSVGMASSPLQG
jgi:hypothetical protein